MTAAITRMGFGSATFGVNAYLLTAADGFVLVDTGTRKHRAELEQRLSEAGCTAQKLSLIIITHGDPDHIGSAVYLRHLWGTPIAMHEGDLAMARDGNMLAGRGPQGFVTRTLLPTLARVRPEDRFEPDILLDEESDLTEYGLPGVRVLLLRAHSFGSIALLLPDGRVLCGDVLENRSRPRIGSIMDDVPAAHDALARLRSLSVSTVYPGHGAPFEIHEVDA